MTHFEQLSRFPGLDARAWDLLVVDEAHTAASPTERHTALAAVAARARRIVAITATTQQPQIESFFMVWASQPLAILQGEQVLGRGLDCDGSKSTARFKGAIEAPGSLSSSRIPRFR